MRLWHKDLIPVLPRQQFLGQWRECHLIIKQIVEQGTPNHILVNKIIEYPISHFEYYHFLIYHEMKQRGYRINPYNTLQLFNKIEDIDIGDYPFYNDLFAGWHDDIYLRECLYNLEEKARSGGIPSKEWEVIYEEYKDFTPLWKGVNNEDN